MKAVKWSTIRLFFLWALIVPAGMVYAYMNDAPQEINWLYLVIFMIFGFLTVYYPIKRNGTPIFLVMWVTIPAFLMYGLFIEMIVMQISILAILFTFSNNQTKMHRFFINSILFYVLSITSAYVFNFVGGKIGSIEFWPIFIGIFCYQFFHTFINDIYLKIYSAYNKIKLPFSTKDILLNYAKILVILPFSLTFYFLIKFIGVGAFLLLGIPFFFVTLIARLYNNSEKVNKNLQQAGDIGHKLSGKLKENEVIDQFVKNVSAMFNAEFSYLFDHNDDWLELIRSYEHEKFIDIRFAHLSPGQGIAGSVLLNNKPSIYSMREEWEDISKDYSPDEMQSVLCVPISRNQKIEAVLLLASARKDAFNEYQLKILDLLCSYFTVSVEKARYVQKAVMKSERCALTKLYNFRFLDERLGHEMERLNNGEIHDLSVAMLDVDHFKKINDTYGHQSGNDILYMLARKLEEVVPEGGIVGRYGGEEFVFILPGMSKVEAVSFSENLRRKIRDLDFLIIPDLGEDKYPVVAHITSSIGVSSAPQDTDEAMALLRNADRALYLGAKQAGRNRVAEYVK